MTQWVNLSVSGLFTSMNDFNGIPLGAMDIANNLEIPYKNIGQPRRGFFSLDNSNLQPVNYIRLTNFPINFVDSSISLGSDNLLRYQNNLQITPVQVPGTLSAGILPADPTYAKSRFFVAGQNLYTTARDGVRSLASGSAAITLRAGVPKALDLTGVATGTTGFFDNNPVLSTLGDITNGSNLLNNLESISGVTIGNYISGPGIPAGTTVVSVTASATENTQNGNLTDGSNQINGLATTAGLLIGMLATGFGIPAGSFISNIISGTAIEITKNVIGNIVGTPVTFTSVGNVTMSNDATATATLNPVTFYAGGQVAYVILYGRTETDQNGATITRLGTPSQPFILTNVSENSVNVTLTATLPKNSENAITFYQLYRSPETLSATISPAGQYNLVAEKLLTPTDFTNRTINILDALPDDFREGGTALYTGSDQEGIGQANDPPPLAWDISTFRNFMVYGNVTFPTSMFITILAVGPPNGVQVNDQISITGNFNGNIFTETYTAKFTEDDVNRQFQIFTSGTDAQNITDTTNSLIRVINYDNAVPVHVILVSGVDSLPGQMVFEADYPSVGDTFTVNASAHKTAYDPTLNSVSSLINVYNNRISVSKIDQLESVPSLNYYNVGDTSSPIVRVIGMRDYIIILKLDGVYKILGNEPKALQVTTFDLTTNIIGPDTAVKLNSSVWMLSNQGVVSISDAGIDAKSVPIDDQLNYLVANAFDNVTTNSFAIGYESDRKYILSVPSLTSNFCVQQYNFSYITNAWTTWSRSIYFGYINSTSNLIYIARADGNQKGISIERKTYSTSDYVDEGTSVTISAIGAGTITLTDASNVSEGDVITQGTETTQVVSINGNVLTVLDSVGFGVGAASNLAAYPVNITWKQVYSGNPAFQRQYSEGLLLFKQANFNEAAVSFSTDYNTLASTLTLPAQLSPALPSTVRFYMPIDQQMGSYLFPSFFMQQGQCYFIFQGMSISYEDISQEVGLS